MFLTECYVTPRLSAWNVILLSYNWKWFFNQLKHGDVPTRKWPHKPTADRPQLHSAGRAMLEPYPAVQSLPTPFHGSGQTAWPARPRGQRRTQPTGTNTADQSPPPQNAAPGLTNVPTNSSQPNSTDSSHSELTPYGGRHNSHN